MREILFRGKRADNGQWIYGDLYHRSICGAISPTIHTMDYTGGSVIPTTVGQYTGLNDRNGKKIFEGDILAVEKINGNIKKRVRYDVELGMWKADRTEGSTQDFELYVYADLGCVIGNIHDNPELLKGGEE